MENWFKFTGKTIDVSGETLNEFVYTKDVMDKKAGEIGGYAADEDCFEAAFSSTNSYFFSGCRIRNGCYIVNSKLKVDTTISSKDIVIENCEMQNAEIIENRISLDPDLETKRGEKTIYKSIIRGTKEKHFSVQVSPQTELEINNSKLTTGATKPGIGSWIIANENSHIKILSSSIILNDKDIIVENGIMKLDHSTITNGDIYIGSDNFINKSVTNIFASFISGKICAGNIDISMSNIQGEVSCNKKNGQIVIKTSTILDNSRVYVCDDAEKLTLNKTNMTNNSMIFFAGEAKELNVTESYIQGDCSLTITEGEKTVRHVEMYNSAAIINSSVFDSQIRGTSVVFHTEISDSIIRENTKIGFCENLEMNKRLLEKTNFKNLNIRNRFDFFVFPVIPNKFYYIFASGCFYRLFENETNVEFKKIGTIENEIRFFIDSINEKDSHCKLSIMGFDVDKTRENSIEFMLKNAFDKRKREYNDLVHRTSTVMLLTILKAIILIAFNYSEQNIEIKRLEKNISNNAKIDLFNKKVIPIEHSMLIVSAFILKNLKRNDFRKNFLKKIENIKTDKNVFFI